MSAPATAPVASVDHLTKRFAGDLRRSLRYALRDIGRELLPGTPSQEPRAGEFAALDGVSFELRPGEALGVVGRNGAGKTTLLKVLYGLLKPDAGEVRLRGRVGGLIELGTGFDPVLSGRENIAVNAAMVGLSPEERETASEDVLAFAELEEAADMPLRYYSTGMRARLAFAVAAQLRPDLLLVDEVLAVGDFAFQRKCFRHMRSFLDRGGALVLVSHNVFLVQALCTRGMLLERGACVYAGSAVDTVARYLAARESEPAAGAAGGAAAGTGPVAIEAVEVSGPGGGGPATGAPLTIALRYRCAEPVHAIWGFTIWTGDEWVCATGAHDLRPRRLEATGELRATIPRLPLLGGTYMVRATLGDAETMQPFDLRGHGDGRPALLRVETPPGVVHNAQRASNQLVTIDVDWD